MIAIGSTSCDNAPVANVLDPVEVEVPDDEADVVRETPWNVVVWNDPINLMSYVSLVFRKLFGYSREKADQLMLDVHNLGRAIVASGTRERCENDVHRLHQHGLWATLERND